MIAFTNTETGVTRVKEFSSDADKLKDYQRYYNSVFGKDKYVFFLADPCMAAAYGCGGKGWMR